MMYTRSMRALSAAALASASLIAAGCSHGQKTRPQTEPNATVTAEDIERSGSDPIEKQLQANAPGVIVSRTGDGGIAVQIRGPATFYGSNEPLYVIDDVPITPGPGGALQGINPHDIESIRVLKNPEDTGIYGVRGANGVIVIRMKRAGRSKP